MHTSSIAVLFLVILSAGCQSATQKLIEERRAALGPKLGLVEGLADEVKAAPPVTEDHLELGKTPLVMSAIKTAPSITGTLIYAEDLDDVSTEQEIAPHYKARISMARPLRECGSLLRRGTYGQQAPQNAHANVAKEFLDACGNVEYVFVLRTRKAESREFIGDVLAFELATGKPLGGFAVDFTSEGRRDKVTNTTTKVTTTRVGNRNRTTVTKTTTTNTVDADAEQLRSDLADAIVDGITRLAPAATWVQ